ncbi:DUF192 domain-containing protein [Maliponia aquimaris]|uniref:DUF192 domain-containing protein n=1 Tax=Maliponia aquimaris TaxID=1673631 RepID=A0A238L671_9RHOB|nr:DUF192 domain-containing protein [Maliponia aquimaris]SMX50595.1 hypothetical protein MAA8898_04867 [Maliponia aquimaris]
MGKRLVALSIVAALIAWPGFAQEDGPAEAGAQETPPVAAVATREEPVAATSPPKPVVPVPAEVAPEDGVPSGDAPVSADAADPAATPDAGEDPDPVVTAEPVDEPPPIDPILPIGDEPLSEVEPDTVAASDPDNAIGACRADTVYIRGDFGKARFTVDVARTAAERSQGLMNVESMPASKGMLFVYPAPQAVAFWMKNTLIPLDMIFADSRGVVVKVHDSAIPGDLTSIPGGDDVQFVLEINGGLARMMGITEGAELRHPAVRRAAWRC